MENQFSRIGQIIMDLDAGKTFEPEPEEFDFLDQEFARITIQLGTEWMDKPMGLGYLLNFHASEAQRLSLWLLKMCQALLQSETDNEYSRYLSEVYQYLFTHLAELQIRINMLINGGDLDLSSLLESK